MNRARRHLFRSSAYLMVATGLGGCKSEPRPATAHASIAVAPKSPENIRCDDTKGLGSTEIKQRSDFKYTDRAPDRQQNCGTCMHLQPAPDADGPCNRCSVLPGTVHVDGWCRAWVVRIAHAGGRRWHG